MSEIDNIFASKGKAKALPPQSSPAVKLSKKKQKKQIIDAHSLPIDKDETTSSSGSSKKRRLPETVVDTSNDIPASFKRQKTSDAKKSKSNRDDKSQVDENDLTSFKDSRGSSGRQKTAEGWSIYTEDELSLSKEGGDTPLCPFDCDCCF